MRTSSAHLALRPILHPVLARPLRGRGSLPLRALLRPPLLPAPCPRLRHTRRGTPDVRPPNRRLRRHEVGAPRSGRETSIRHHCTSNGRFSSNFRSLDRHNARAMKTERQPIIKRGVADAARPHATLPTVCVACVEERDPQAIKRGTRQRRRGTRRGGLARAHSRR